MILLISAPEMLDPKAKVKGDNFSWASKIPRLPSPLTQTSVQSYALSQELQNNTCLKTGANHRYKQYVVFLSIMLFIILFYGIWFLLIFYVFFLLLFFFIFFFYVCFKNAFLTMTFCKLMSLISFMLKLLFISEI